MDKIIDKQFLCFRYEMQGQITYFSIFGFNIYERIGNLRSLFGMAWKTNGE